jgi:hypothetical protein
VTEIPIRGYQAARKVGTIGGDTAKSTCTGNEATINRRNSWRSFFDPPRRARLVKWIVNPSCCYAGVVYRSTINQYFWFFPPISKEGLGVGTVATTVMEADGSRLFAPGARSNCGFTWAVSLARFLE